MCNNAELDREIHDLKRDVRTLNSFQKAVKIIINQLYGAFGNDHFYFANQDVAASITAQGRNLIHFSIKSVNNYFQNVWHNDVELHKKLGIDTNKVKPIGGIPVIYVDTDSNYVNFDILLKSIEDIKFPTFKDSAQFILDVLNERFEKYLDDAFNAYAAYFKVDNRMVFKMEKVCASAIWVAKKNYAYRTIFEEFWQDIKTKASGLPCTKPSYPKKSREILWRMLDILLDKNNNIVVEKDVIPALMKEFELFKKSDPDDICFNKYVRGLHKYTVPVDEYDLVSRCDQNGNEVKYAKNKLTGEIHTIETKKKGVYDAEIVEEFGGYYLTKGCGGDTKGCVRYNNNLDKCGNSKYTKIKSGDKIKSFYLNEDNDVFCFAPGDYDSSVCDPINYEEQFYRSVTVPLNALLNAMNKHEITRDFKRDLKVKKALAKTKKKYNSIEDIQYYCVNKETAENYIIDKTWNPYTIGNSNVITSFSASMNSNFLDKYDEAIGKFGNNLILVPEEELNDYLVKLNESIQKKLEKKKNEVDDDELEEDTDSED